MCFEIRFVRERSEPRLLKIEFQNLSKLDFCEQSELRLPKMEVETLWKLEFLQAKQATFAEN